MGNYLLDTFSFLHLATGIVVYYWRINLPLWIIINIIYEISENTMFGLNIINKIKYWPGGKTMSDNIINSIGDIIFGILGWFIGAYIDTHFNKRSIKEVLLTGRPQHDHLKNN